MKNLTLDRIDVKIINELQNDARLTNAELALRVNLSPSPCLTRVKRLEDLGVIERSVALVNPHAVGLGVSAFIQVRFEKQGMSAIESFQNSMNPIGEIMECYLMTGDCEYLLRVVASDIEELDHLVFNRLAKLEGVVSIRSNIVLRQVRCKTALPINDSRPISVRPQGYVVRGERALANAR